MFLTLYATDLTTQFQQFAQIPDGATIEISFEPNARAPNGETAISVLVRECAPPPSFKPKLQFLVDRGADINATTTLGLTPLQLAIIMNLPAASHLLDNGANPYVLSQDGFPVLHYATAGDQDYLPLIKRLIAEFKMSPFKEYKCLSLFGEDPTEFITYTQENFGKGPMYSAFDLTKIRSREMAPEILNMAVLITDSFLNIDKTAREETIQGSGFKRMNLLKYNKK